MSPHQSGKTFPVTVCPLWVPETDLVVDHLLVLVIFLQGGAKLHNIRVLRVAVLSSASEVEPEVLRRASASN